MYQIQDLAAAMLELWNLMDTPQEEQQMFQNVTSKIAASEDEIIEPGMLSLSNIKNVRNYFKFFQWGICRKTHMVTEVLSSIANSIKAMETGKCLGYCKSYNFFYFT